MEPKSDNMKIDFYSVQGAQVFRPIGNLNRTTAPQLEAFVVDKLEPGARIILDLSETTTISSAGLRVLFIIKKMVQNDDQLVLASPNTFVADVLGVTGFDDLIVVRDSVEAAVNQR